MIFSDKMKNEESFFLYFTANNMVFKEHLNVYMSCLHKLSMVNIHIKLSHVIFIIDIITYVFI